MNYESIFNYVMYSSNLNSNSSELSYDPRVTSFQTPFDPPSSYEFDNIVLIFSGCTKIFLWNLVQSAYVIWIKKITRLIL